MNSILANRAAAGLALIALLSAPAGAQEATPAPSAVNATAAPSPAAPAANPAPTADPLPYKTVPQPQASAEPGAPVILEVDLNDTHLRTHGRIAMRILTSPDVVSVVSRSKGHQGEVPRVGPGVFYAESTLPGVPFVARGMHLNLEFVATTADGKSTSVRVPVILG